MLFVLISSSVSPIFNGTISDNELVRDMLTKSPYGDLITVISRLFEVGALMEFFINSGAISKTIETRAISLRRKNEKVVSKFMNIIKKAEPVLWGETLMLIQTRLSSKISPA